MTEILFSTWRPLLLKAQTDKCIREKRLNGMIIWRTQYAMKYCFNYQPIRDQYHHRGYSYSKLAVRYLMEEKNLSMRKNCYYPITVPRCSPLLLCTATAKTSIFYEAADALVLCSVPRHVLMDEHSGRTIYVISYWPWHKHFNPCFILNWLNISASLCIIHLSYKETGIFIVMVTVPWFQLAILTSREFSMSPISMKQISPAHFASLNSTYSAYSQPDTSLLLNVTRQSTYSSSTAGHVVCNNIWQGSAKSVRDFCN